MSKQTGKPWRWGRLLALLLGGCAVLGGALFIRLFWLERPMGNGPAGPSVPHAAFAQVWTTRPVLLLGLGDSVTAGFGASRGHGYFDRLVENPPDEWPDMRGIHLRAVLPNLRVVDRSVSGSTSFNHLMVQVRGLKRADPKTLGLVVMTTGGNDIIHNYGKSPPQEGAMFGATMAQARPWIAAFEERIEEMVRLLGERFPGGCHLFLANIYDPTDGVGTAGTVGLPSWPDGLAILAAYNEILVRVAEKHQNVHLVDIRTPLLGHGIYCRQFWRSHYHRDDPHYWYHENFEDPNDRGYDAIRRIFLLEMAKVVPSL
jgi:lysophospholipase L1-like esterase